MGRSFLNAELEVFINPLTPRETAKEIPVVEVFSAFQGEGALIGTPTIFLRLGGCDYHCTWCDSLYAVSPKYNSSWVRMLPEEVLRAVDAANSRIRHITLTGGNPAIHKKFEPHLTMLQQAGYSVAIETQGTVFPDWANQIDHVTLSPKPPSSTNVTDPSDPNLIRWIESKAIQMGEVWSHEAYYVFYDAVCLKIVIFDTGDLDYAAEVHATYPAVPMFLQPGTAQPSNRETGHIAPWTVRQQVADSTIKLQEIVDADRRFDLSIVRVIPQLHSMLHGLGRGF